MIGRLAISVGLAVAFAVATPTQANWIFRPSHYSHDPNTGERVAQYAEKEPSYAPRDPTYVKSGYRHRRLTTRSLDGSVDRLHLVETWGHGEQIRPYGEWQRPFRAGATPYGPWGNPGGPWTTPFESWDNPYGLGRLPYGYSNGGYPYAGPYPQRVPYAGPYSNYGDAPPPAGHPGHGGHDHSGEMPVEN